MTGLAEKLKLLPALPGVYLFMDSEGRIIYIGKADSLRDRVRSYFSAAAAAHPRLRALAGKIEDFEYIACRSGMEALLLECTLIKTHMPRYNVRFRDDKKYPYIKLSGDEYPGLSLTRTLRRDGSVYYGPFTDAAAARETVKTLSRIFLLRTCRKRPESRARPCLYYHIARCSGPCARLVPKEEYLMGVERVRQFLSGRWRGVLRDLERRMCAAKEKLDFEKAAALRDSIVALKSVSEKQNMEKTGGGDEDYISFLRGGSGVTAGVISVRNGRMVRFEAFTMASPPEVPGAEILSSFIKQRYSSPREAPPGIIVPELPEDAPLIEEWLGAKRESRVRLHVPLRGRRRALLEKLDGNLALKAAEAEAIKRTSSRQEALMGLASLAGLAGPPELIEGFDAAHISGSWAVGAVVLFKDGFPERSGYRRFRVQTRPGDDTAMLEEIVRRRYRRALSGGGELPGLVVVDGGRAQVGAARAGLESTGIDIPVIGLAKRKGTVYLDKGHAVEPGIDAPYLSLLKHLMDEAHRTATSYHTKLRRRESSASVLDGVRGLGKERKLALLREFGDTSGIASASEEQLMKVDGIGPSLSARIKEVLSHE